jgi:hypothetical protein
MQAIRCPLDSQGPNQRAAVHTVRKAEISEKLIHSAISRTGAEREGSGLSINR